MAEFANDSIKGLEELLKALKGTKDELKEIIKLQEQRAKEIDVTKAQAKEMTELAKATQQVAKAEREIERLNEQEKKTLIQLEKVNAEKVKTEKQEFDLKVKKRKEQERLNKLSEKERKQQEKLNSEYAKQSKRLNDLRKKYKDLRLSTGKNTKETKKLQKEIEELDKTLKDVDAEVGQFQRNVGNYPKAAAGAKTALGTLSGFLTGIFVSAIGKSRDQVRAFQGGLERVGNVVRVVAQETIIFFNNVIIPSIENLSLKFEKLSLNIESYTNGIGGDEGINARLAELDTQMKKNSDSIDDYTFSWDELTTTLEKTDQNIVDRIERQDRLIDRTAKLTNEIQILQTEEAVLEANIGNSNFSFAERAKQIDQLIVKQDLIIDKERELAEENFKNAATSIRNDLLRRKLIKTNEDLTDSQIRSLSFLDDKAQADAISIDNLNKLTAATTRLNEVERQSQIQDATALKERLDNRRDLFEQELDFALDISDRQKSVNERLIASDQQTVQEKFKTFAETERILNDSYDNQIKLTEDFIEESARLRGVDITGVDIRSLATMDEAEARRTLIDAGIADEITQNRIREIIIERKAAVQDLLDLQEEITAQAREEQMAQEDAEFALFEARRDISLRNREFNTEQRIEDFEEAEEFNKKKLESAKEALEEQKEAELELFLLQKNFELERVETAEDRLRIEEEIRQGELEISRKYYQALEDLDKTASEKQIENAEEVLQQKADIFNKLTSALREELETRNEAELESIDGEISDREKSIERQAQLAEKGLKNQLAFEQAQLEKANLEKLEAEKEAQQKEELLRLAEIFGESYLARLQAGETGGEAIAGATSDTFVYRGLAKAIVQGAFYEGTESVEDSLGKPMFKGKDGYVIAVDGQERIFNPEHSKMVKGLSNKELAEIGNRYKKGEIGVDTRQIEGKLQQLIDKPIQKIDIDKLGNIIETVEKGRMKTITRLKTRGRL